jgi:predicted transcriptional regulator
MLARAERDFDVFLSSNIARDSARYLVAEQIGHYVVHYLDVRRGQHEAYTVDTVYAAKPASSELAATEAVWFASAFLMPSGLVDDFCSERTRTVTQVADEFDVSAMTAQNRLRRLQRLAADGVTTLGVHEGHASLIYSA